MTAFEVVTIAVSLIAIALCFTTYFRIRNVEQELLGRRMDPPIEERPDEERDEPIPRRPLRGAPE